VEHVNDAWEPFAQANGAPGLSPRRVVGESIWSFVHGSTVQHLWQLVFGRARVERKALLLPYRCDGPGVRRYLEMELVAPDGVSVVCTSRTMREEPRPVVQMLLGDGERSGESLIVCSWCNRAQLHRTWVEIEQAIDELHLFGVARPPSISHGICDRCVREVLR